MPRVTPRTRAAVPRSIQSSRAPKRETAGEGERWGRANAGVWPRGKLSTSHTTCHDKLCQRHPDFQRDGKVSTFAPLSSAALTSGDALRG